MVETDDEIVARVKGGDQGAFRVLVERHSRSVYRLAYRMMGKPEDAEDVVQEALFRAFRQIQTFTGEASFRTWLVRIASNHCLDLIQRRKRHAPLPHPAEGFEIAAPEPLPDRVAETQLAQRRIDRALRMLTAQERAAFLLRHCEGESIPEIAEALGLNQSAAKQSIFRAVRKLRRSLEPLLEVTS
jgi:RNA polymerase sigma-70 factor (ECF subfamily)